jgi:hypothetical protein
LKATPTCRPAPADRAERDRRKHWKTGRKEHFPGLADRRVDAGGAAARGEQRLSGVAGEVRSDGKGTQAPSATEAAERRGGAAAKGLERAMLPCFLASRSRLAEVCSVFSLTFPLRRRGPRRPSRRQSTGDLGSSALCQGAQREQHSGGADQQLGRSAEIAQRSAQGRFSRDASAASDEENTAAAGRADGEARARAPVARSSAISARASVAIAFGQAQRSHPEAGEDRGRQQSVQRPRADERTGQLVEEVAGRGLAEPVAGRLDSGVGPAEGVPEPSAERAASKGSGRRRIR